MQRLRIKQDDTGKVKIVDEETGLSLENVTFGYTITHDAPNKLPTVELRVYAPLFDMLCNAKIVRCDGEGKCIDEN